MAAVEKDITVSIRINPFKTCDLSHLPMEEAVPWSPFGRYLSRRPCFTLDPLFHAGAYYVQDASAMFTGWMFRKALDYLETATDHRSPAGLRVLDLCAAPGGKSTDIAASLRLRYGASFLLVCNEAIRSRASVLQDNMAVWGDPNTVLCSSDASSFGRLGRDVFDIIVADVPCSGEGMFRKSENARQMWSEDNVALCTARQRRIVADVWNSLREGGILLYSTCTFNDSENDGNVAWITENLGAGTLQPELPFDGPQKTSYGYLLTPECVRGEGQYCAALVKGVGGTVTCDAVPEDRAEVDSQPQDGGCSFFDRNGTVFALPEAVSEAMSLFAGKLNVLGAGVHCFDRKGADSVPYADLALSMLLDPGDFPSAQLDLQSALRFLHRDALLPGSLPPDLPKGYAVVKYADMPLGFVKNLGSRANNLHPMSRRIIMNI